MIDPSIETNSGVTTLLAIKLLNFNQEYSC